MACAYRFIRQDQSSNGIFHTVIEEKSKRFPSILNDNHIEMFRPTILRSTVRFQSAVALPTPKVLSNAYVGALETRWSHLPKPEQKTLISELNARMELPWQELTTAEKKAAYYISFGAWGPRKPLHKAGEINKVIWGVVGGFGAAIGLFAFIRMFAAPPPRTLTREWQDASDEYLKSQNANPFTGYSQVQ